MDNALPIFQYLKAKQIAIDQEEFSFQFKSHPDYPSLLAISDTLHFFNVASLAVKVASSDLELLPDAFVAHLKRDNKSFLSFLKRKGDSYRFLDEATQKVVSVSKEKITPIWGEVVLLLENEGDVITDKTKKGPNFFLTALFISLLAMLLYGTFSNFWILSFYVFPIIGFLLSIAALKDLFNTKNELLKKLCHATLSSGCETLAHSSKWKILEKVSFSDLSITFFATQIVSLVLMGLTRSYSEYFTVQAVLLLLSVPVIALSLYYQKFVEKKWCPICLSIIAVVLLELLYVFAFSTFLIAEIRGFPILLYLFVYVAILMFWYPLRTLFERINHLKKEQLKANRFKRNYALFKNTLISKQKYSIPQNPIVLGNKSAPIRIDIITSPYCSHCTEPYYLLKRLLKKYEEHLAVAVMYNVNMRQGKGENLKSLLRNLLHTKLKKGDDAFNTAMEDWLQHKNHEKWLAKHNGVTHSGEIDLILDTQYKWCNDNSFHFTPCVFINGFQYPDTYEISDLPFFIDELIEDPSLQNR